MSKVILHYRLRNENEIDDQTVQMAERRRLSPQAPPVAIACAHA